MADDAEPAETGAAARISVDGGPCDDGMLPTSRMGEGALPDLPTLVAAHADVLYRYAYRLTGSAADAEDLAQQTFLIAHQKLSQLRDAGCVRGWLLAVLRRAYLKLQKRARPEQFTFTTLDIDSLPQEAVDHWEIDREQLQAAIDELPDAYKLVVLSYYFEDLSYREIAERFELPVGTVMSRLSRAKDHLRARLWEAEPAVARSS
jgi:RNA polymerase sigma-70 factor (ECF subfamily)